MGIQQNCTCGFISVSAFVLCYALLFLTDSISLKNGEGKGAFVLAFNYDLLQMIDLTGVKYWIKLVMSLESLKRWIQFSNCKISIYM